MLLLQDNAPVHIEQAVLYTCECHVIIYPPYSSDFTTANSYLIPKMKKEFRGNKFSNDKEINSAVVAYFEGRQIIFLCRYN